MRKEPISFVVEGSGQFPIDMLRYDDAWPASESNSAIIQHENGPRHVKLLSVATFITPARWASFGWRVVEIEGEPLEAVRKHYAR